MSTTHPSLSALQRWLETGQGKHIEEHVGTCPQCQQVLDELTSLNEDTRQGLMSAVAPPEDLAARTRVGVDDRLRQEAAVSAFADLFAIGLDFVRFVGGAEPDRDEPHSDAPSTDGDSDV